MARQEECIQAGILSLKEAGEGQSQRLSNNNKKFN
jgi:hypothetical protein|tara:strand:- start:1517 stop:1621 length:105 start_codon:yes stop_codon:yes gene_type:complete